MKKYHLIKLIDENNDSFFLHSCSPTAATSVEGLKLITILLTLSEKKSFNIITFLISR